jgi:hypothetical protein
MKKRCFTTYFLFFITIVFAIGFFIFFRPIFAYPVRTLVTTVKISVCGNGIKENGEHCDGNTLGPNSCSTLGFTGGILHCTPACEFNTVDCTTNANSAATPVFTSTSGGAYTMLNNNNSAATVNLPPNFNNCDTRMQMFSYEKTVFQTAKPPPPGKNFCGKVYDFVFVDANGENISTLSKPALITMTYTDEEISGLNENTIAPYRRGSSDAGWQLISGSTIDTANNTITFSNAAFSSIAILGETAVASETTNSSSGTSGSGSTYSPTAIKFSGRAYPKSTVTLLKDAQVAATTIADNDANFQLSLSGLSAGSYLFSLYSEDYQGNRSSLITFPANVVAGTANNLEGIFIAPTLGLDKAEIKYGDNLVIFGQSVPYGEINIDVNSATTISLKTKADVSGVYLYNFNTTALDLGQHFAKSKVTAAGNLSSFSKAASFIVGDKTVVSKPTTSLKGDLNSDKKVNLIDFSILAYWYQRPAPLSSVDLNGDGKVNLIDFSILAFYWTG